MGMKIDTDIPPEELRRKLKSLEPWSHRIDFSNGVSTADFERRVPFQEDTLGKLRMIDRTLPLDSFAGKKVLDVGSNIGHHSIEMARRGACPVGVEWSDRHTRVARMLAELAGVEAEFITGSAEDFCRPDTFELILHLGTLYHLPNPVLALQQAVTSLKSGGTLVIETQMYDRDEDEQVCAFMHGVNNDPTNWWALSTTTLNRILERLGMTQIREVFRAHPPIMPEHHSRAIIIAVKPPTHTA